jgi:deoxycytidine triphosphate deaminase/uncharacterized membrane protein YidH (DUF202 family)
MGALSAREIEARHEEIFAEGTFSEGCLRGAAYDLRIRDDGENHELETTGRVAASKLYLDKGDSAVVETHECLTMPWNLSGNIGVKAQWSLQGLFVTQGLFVDPGFGWVGSDPDNCAAHGARLRFMLTNMGHQPIAIRLGDRGEPVIGIQFLPVEEPSVREAVEERKANPQALAIFADMRDLGTQVDEMQTSVRRDVEELEKTVDQIDGATKQVVLFGVFLVAATLIGASIASILATVGSSDGVARTVRALNDLDTSRPWTIVILVATVLVILTCVTLLAYGVSSVYSTVVRRGATAGPRPKQGGAGRES